MGFLVALPKFKNNRLHQLYKTGPRNLKNPSKTDKNLPHDLYLTTAFVQSSAAGFTQAKTKMTSVFHSAVTHKGRFSQGKATLEFLSHGTAAEVLLLL